MRQSGWSGLGVRRLLLLRLGRRRRLRLKALVLGFSGNLEGSRRGGRVTYRGWGAVWRGFGSCGDLDPIFWAF